MKDEHKTKKQLIEELVRLRREIDGLKKGELGKGKYNESDVIEYRQLLSIFDGIDEGIYIADPETYEMLYANYGVRKIFGEIKGKSCYKYLQDIDSPCSFCSNDRIFGERLGDTHIWEFENMGNGRWYRCIDRAIPWPDGRMVRCEIAIDIDDAKRAEEALLKSREEFRGLALHLQKVREEERTSVARDIHDELGQLLTAIKIDADWVSKKLNEGQKPLLDRTRDISKISDDAIQAVKKIATELRPALLDDLGLAAALEWQAEEFEHRTGIRCELAIESLDVILSKSLAIALFRIFQEALTNVARYSCATKVDAGLKRSGGEVILEIVDNGKGISERDMSKPDSFGLLGMRERLYPWSGEFTISAVKRKGTTVRATIPIPGNDKRRSDEEDTHSG